MGQVISVIGGIFIVLLLIDFDYVVLVIVVCNGVCLIVYGRGDMLELCDILFSVGVEVGDEIVIFGFGGCFLVGFLVGIIIGLCLDDIYVFLVGELKLVVQFDRGCDVLLLCLGVVVCILLELCLQLEEIVLGGLVIGVSVFVGVVLVGMMWVLVSVLVVLVVGQ